MERDLREEAVAVVEEWAVSMLQDPVEIVYVRNAEKKLPMLWVSHALN